MPTRGPNRGRPRGRVEARPMETVLRALDILDCLSDSPVSLGVTDIVRQVKLPPATVYRALITLASRGIVDYDPETHRYGVGIRLMQYGLRQLSGMKLHRLVHPYLVELNDKTQETAVLALRAGFDRVYVDQIESPKPVRHVQQLWERQPLYLGSSGRTILAFLPPEEIEAYLAQGPYPRLTPNTITDPDTLRDRLEQIRARGYDFTVAERLSDTAGLAAPILDHRNQSVGSILVCGPAYRSEFIQRFAELVRSKAMDCSLRMGYKPGQV